MKNKYLLALSAGHAFTDINQGALPAILPFIIAAGGLKYTEAAGLSFAVALSSSIVQPVFGILSDKLAKPWLLPLGVLLAGCGLSLIGFFPDNYWLMFIAAIICGLGVAAYHPESARMANKMAGEKKSGNMSIYSVGGNIGFAFGPMLATPALLHFGLRGSAVMAIPAITMFMVFSRISPSMYKLGAAPEGGEAATQEVDKNEWGKFLWLSFAIIARSVINQGLNTFLPLYWINVLQQSEATSAMVLSFLFFCGAVATVLGGHLADRIGLNNLIKLSWALLIPSLFFLTRTTDPRVAFVLLAPIALGLHSSNTPMVLLGQKYLPANIGFASGVTLGLAVSIGGIMAPLLGNYADHNGLTATLRFLSLLPPVGVLVAMTIKPPAIA